MSALSRNQILALVAVALAAALAFLYWNALAGWWDVNGTVLRQALVTGVLIGSVYGLVAMGLTLIFGVLDIINFAQGSMLAIGMYLALVLYEAFGVDPYLSILVTAPVLFLLGMAVERLMIHPARNAPAHNQLLLTLGLALFIENFLLVTFTATPRAIRLPYEREAFDLGVLLLDFPLRVGGTTITMPRLAAFLFALALALVLYYLLQHTRFGRTIRAAAQNREGARLIGLRIDRINMVTFGIGAACAGAAGSILLPFLAVDPQVGNVFNITAFVVVVLGGLGSIPGALLGGIVIGLTQELSVVFFPSSTKLLGVFAIFILVLLFRPQGLLGRRP